VHVLPFALVAPGLSGPLLLLHYITHDLNNATVALRSACRGCWTRRR
jgi:ATP-binding cassette, subfamily B, bacterial IrtA/YbtP